MCDSRRPTDGADAPEEVQQARLARWRNPEGADSANAELDRVFGGEDGESPIRFGGAKPRWIPCEKAHPGITHDGWRAMRGSGHIERNPEGAEPPGLPDSPEGTVAAPFTAAEAYNLGYRHGREHEAIEREAALPKTIEQIAAEQGIGPVTADSLRMESLTEEEARAFDEALAVEPSLDVERIQAALIEWKHRGHRIDSNGYCDDCMRFVDVKAAEDAAEIVEADTRLASEKGTDHE